MARDRRGAAPQDADVQSLRVRARRARPGARQLTHTTGGATWPDVSPDGRDDRLRRLHRRRLRPVHDAVSSRARPSRRTPAVLGSAPASGATRGDRDSRRLTGDAGIHPLATLMPTSWLPVIEADSDQVAPRRRRRRHRRARLSRLRGVRDLACRRALRRADADAAHARLASSTTPTTAGVPTFFASASCETSFFAGPATEAGHAVGRDTLASEI